MSVTITLVITPFLRNTLLLDGLVSGAAGVADGRRRDRDSRRFSTCRPPCSPGQAVCCSRSCVAACRSVAARDAAPAVLIDIIAINALWVAASFGLLVSGAVAPNLLGYGFVVMQALAVAVFAELQIVGVRRNRTAAA